MLCLGLALLLAASDPAAEYAARAEKIGTRKDPKPWLELADFCEDRLLFGQREEALRKALAIDPDHPAARARLDEVRHGKSWLPAGEAETREILENESNGLAYYGTRWIPAKEAGKRLAADSRLAGWTVRTRVDTPHLAVYSARPLGFTRCLASVLDREASAYRRFYGRAWRLPDRPKPIQVHVFGDRESFVAQIGPIRQRAGMGEVPSTTSGTYATDTQTLYIGMKDEASFSEERILKTAVHKMLHALDHQWMDLTAANSPPWLLERRANHFAYSLRGRQVLPGGMAVPAADSMAGDIATGVRALPVSELLAMDQKTLYAKTLQNYAVSTAFVYFLFHGEGGRHAEGFRKYLQGLPKRSAGSDLEAALGTRLADLQPAFEEYVTGTLLPSATNP